MSNQSFRVIPAVAIASLLVGVPAGVEAVQPADAGGCSEAQRCLDLLRDGIVLLEAGRWEGASNLLEEAAAGLDGQPAHVHDLARAYVYLGVARLQVADSDETLQWFAEAQMRNPTLQLDPAEFPRDVMELWDEARDLGTLLVDSEPSGAEVSVDGMARGRSPVGVAGLKPGEYRVTLAHDGYAGVSRMLTVAPGRTESLFLSLVPLVPLAGAVETRRQGVDALASIPDGISTTAGLSFDEAPVKQAPVNVVPIPDRFPAGTAKKTGRSWWRTLAGLAGVAAGVATMIEKAYCVSGGGNLYTDSSGDRLGGLVEAFGGTLGTDPLGYLRSCKLEYSWRMEVPDLGVGFRGRVSDHELVKSGAYDPFSDPEFISNIVPSPDGWNFGHMVQQGSTPEAAYEMMQDPSFKERLHQALLESVGEGAGSRYHVPKRYLIAGGAAIAAGALLATIWSDVTVVENLAVGVTPNGGVLASRSFGW